MFCVSKRIFSMFFKNTGKSTIWFLCFTFYNEDKNVLIRNWYLSDQKGSNLFKVFARLWWTEWLNEFSGKLSGLKYIKFSILLPTIWEFFFCYFLEGFWLSFFSSFFLDFSTRFSFLVKLNNHLSVCSE